MCPGWTSFDQRGPMFTSMCNEAVLSADYHNLIGAFNSQVWVRVALNPIAIGVGGAVCKVSLLLSDLC